MSKRKEIQLKTLMFDVKEAQEDANTGYLKGFASIAGNIDQGFDIVHPGAFKKTIADKKGVFPMLLDHKPTKPAGYQKAIEEMKGLQIEAEVKLFDPEVKQRYELAKLSLKMGAPMGMSIGYTPVKEEFETVNGRQIRHLKEVRLWETSLVIFPMNEEALVNAAKSWEAVNSEDLGVGTELFIESMLRKGYSESDIFSALDSHRAAHGKKNPELDFQFLSEQIKKIEQACKISA